MGSFKDLCPASPASTGPGVPVASVHTWRPAPPRTGRTAHNQISRTWPRVPALPVCATCLTCLTCPASAAMTSLLGVGWAGALNLIICRNLEKAGPWLGPDQTVAAGGRGRGVTSSAAGPRTWCQWSLHGHGVSTIHQYLAITIVSTLTVTHDNKPVRRCSYYLPKLGVMSAAPLGSPPVSTYLTNCCICCKLRVSTFSATLLPSYMFDLVFIF